MWRRTLRGLVNVVVVGVVIGGVALVGGVYPTALTLAASCSTAGTTGLTAALVASAGQTVTGAVDATGCDIGIYVGPGTANVTITGATISGANDHGIFVEDSSNVTVENSTVSGNGVAPTKGVADDKAIELAGTSNSTVANNTVTGNHKGGISIVDDGKVDPGAPSPGTPSPATGNTISGNSVVRNTGDCGIILAAYNPGQGVTKNVVTGNTSSRNPVGIVVATDPPGTSATDNQVVGNTVSNNFAAGIVVHSNAPGSTLSGTVIKDNVISGNGPFAEAGHGTGPTQSVGIVLAGEVMPVANTTITGNVVTNEYYVLWTFNASQGTTGTGQMLSTSVAAPVPNGRSASFTVSFSSSVAGQGEVYFGSGPGCLGLVQVGTQDLHPGTTNHTVVVTGNDLPGTVGNIGLVPGTYSYELVTVTPSGTQVDDNGGTCYTVTIPTM